MAEKLSSELAHSMRELIVNLKAFANGPNKTGSHRLREEISRIESRSDLDARTRHFLQLAYEAIARPYKRIFEDIANWIDSYRGLSLKAFADGRELRLYLIDGTSETIDLDAFAAFAAFCNRPTEELNNFILINGGRTLRWPLFNEQYEISD